MRRLHRATMLVAFLPKLKEVFRASLPFLAASFFSKGRDQTELIISMIGLLGGFSAISTYVTTRFGIEDGHLFSKSGWIWRQDRRIPLAQIHNVNITQNVLERVLKVASVDVETAAGSGPEIKLRVMSVADAESFRMELLAEMDHETSVAVEQAEANAKSPLLQLSFSDLILGAATENHFLHVAYLVLPTAFVASIPVVLLSSGVIKFIPQWVWISLGLGFPFLLFLAGWVWGGANYLLKFGNFHLQRDGAFFRINHGWISKTQFSIRPERIELLQIAATAPQRLLQRCNVYVGTAGSFGEEGGLAPLGLMVDVSRAEAASADVMPEVSVTDSMWKTFPPQYLRLKAFEAILSIGTIGGVVWAGWTLIATSNGNLVQKGSTAIILFSLMALLRLLGYVDAVLARHRAGYIVEDRFIAVRTGFLTETVRIVPVHRLEYLNTSQPIWWKRFQIVRLETGGMVHRIIIPTLPEVALAKIQSAVLRRNKPVRPRIEETRHESS